MKILYHHRTLADGAEGVHIEQIVRALRGLEHDVRVWSLIGQQTNRRSGRASALGRLKAALPKMLFELAEIGYGAPAGVRLYAAARRFGANLIYERYACANAAGVLAKRALGIPLILEVNAPLVLERQEFEGGLALPGALAGVERYVFRHADRCIVVSTPLADYLEGLGTARARIEIMPNGADATRFDPNRRADALRERLGITGGPVVGFTGVVRRPWHGPELLVEAVARCGVSQAMILFIGDGPAVDDIRALARDFGIGERVVVTGRVAHDEIPDYLAACDVTVSPRATFYASPMKIPGVHGGRPGGGRAAHAEHRRPGRRRPHRTVVRTGVGGITGRAATPRPRKRAPAARACRQRTRRGRAAPELGAQCGARDRDGQRTPSGTGTLVCNTGSNGGAASRRDAWLSRRSPGSRSCVHP